MVLWFKLTKMLSINNTFVLKMLSVDSIIYNRSKVLC